MMTEDDRPVCPLCEAPRVPEGWQLLAFPPSALQDASIDEWDALVIAAKAGEIGCEIVPYGTSIPALLADALSFEHFLEAAAIAGHGSYCVDAVDLHLRAHHLMLISAAHSEFDCVDFDAIYYLNPRGLRRLAVTIELIIADLERRLAETYGRDDHRLEWVEVWRRQQFTALARAASAEERAQSAQRDSAQRSAEATWY